MDLTRAERSDPLAQERNAPSRDAEIGMLVVMCQLFPSTHIPKEPTSADAKSARLISTLGV